MPKFIGNDKREGTRLVSELDSPRQLVKLSYSQQLLLPAELVFVKLDTSDRGSKGSYAKRWYRWYAHASAVATNPASTKKMKTKAEAKLSKF